MSKLGPTVSPGGKVVPKPALDHQLSYARHQDAQVVPRRASLSVNFYSKPHRNEIDLIDDVTGVTALIKACEDHSVIDVQELLEKGASVNAADSNDRSPLMVASAEGNLEIVMILLQHQPVGGDKNHNHKKTKEGDYSDTDSSEDEDNKKIDQRSLKQKHHLKSEALDSSSAVDAKGVERDDDDDEKLKDGSSPRQRVPLVSQRGVPNLHISKPDIDIEAKDKYGWTALMYAALCGHESIVCALIDKNTNIHAVNIKKRTALHIAITYNKLNVANILLQNGALSDINALDVHEWTPAMSACKRGEIEAVNFCLENGSFLSVNKKTLLIIAAEYGHLELVKSLLERKIKPSLGLRDVENELILICAAENRHIAIVQFMLEYGVNIDAVNEMGQTALLVACSKGHEEIINFLLQRHANIFYEDGYGYTAYLYASQNNLIQVVKLLISKGVKINSASSKSGIQALMCAAKAGHYKLAVLFLELYAVSIDATDRTKKSALHYSCIGGHMAIADLLIAKGARYSKDIFKKTPLYYARHNGHFEVAAALEHKYGDKKILMRADLQPVSTVFDILFLTVTASACYVDIIFDVINAYTFYQHHQYQYFSLALFFQVIPLLAAVTLQKGWGTKVMAILHLSVIREYYHSIRGKVETPMMCTLRIIETCLEACPSSLLQLYVLVNTWLSIETSGHAAKGFYGFLPTSQEQLLLLSIAISIGSTSITFIKFVSSEKDRSLMPVKSIVNCFVNIGPEKLSNVEGVYCYHCCEELFRLLTLVLLFVVLKGWALVVVAVMYITRMILATIIYNTENFAECTKRRQYVKIFLRIALSQITDCLWYNHFKHTLTLQIVSTLEGIACSLVLLYLQDSNTLNFSRIQIVLVIGGMTWVLKTSLYLLTYFWMCTESTPVLITDTEDFGIYYLSSKQLAQIGKVTPAEVTKAGEGGDVEAPETLTQADEKEEYESHALMDRKNYFRSIMKGVKKTTASKFQYNYRTFPPMSKSEILLLKAIKQEIDNKHINLKRGLTNVRHNEDFHLLYPQFFQAVRNLAPQAIEAMILSSLTESKTKGRVERSPLRLLFNVFLVLQIKELLGSGDGNITSNVGPSSMVFPDRVDWVEFLDFVKKVEVTELISTGD